MNKQEFKERWEGDDSGGGITFDDIAQCAIDWGISRRPRTCSIGSIRYLVLKEAGTVDAEDYNPNQC